LVTATEVTLPVSSTSIVKTTSASRRAPNEAGGTAATKWISFGGSKEEEGAAGGRACAAGGCACAAGGCACAADGAAIAAKNHDKEITSRRQARKMEQAAGGANTQLLWQASLLALWAQTCRPNARLPTLNRLDSNCRSSCCVPHICDLT
jgi:hypothetical protein